MIALMLAACGNSDNNNIDTKTNDDETPSSTDSNTSTYTPSTPSTTSRNEADYNSKGEYKPADSMTKDELRDELEDIIESGPAYSPQDYNSSGEHKPVDKMTQDEIRAELEDMLNGSLGN